jgi:AcrR family transcriptional regulator
MDALRDRLLDAALARAAVCGWDALQLHALAREQGLPLADLQACFSGKDALAEALLDRAERALLAEEIQGSARERLEAALQAWFAVLAPHRAVLREMLAYKQQPDHLHLRAAWLLRVSRTVQWWREAAALDERGWRREAVEVALSAIFLGSLRRWLRDEAEGLRWLAQQLRRAEGLRAMMGR